MEAEIIALSACCRVELFPIIDMVHSLAEATNLPIRNTTMNVSIYEDNFVKRPQKEIQLINVL